MVTKPASIRFEQRTDLAPVQEDAPHSCYTNIAITTFRTDHRSTPVAKASYLAQDPGEASEGPEKTPEGPVHEDPPGLSHWKHGPGGTEGLGGFHMALYMQARSPLSPHAHRRARGEGQG